MRFIGALIVSLLLLPTTSVMAGSSSIPNSGGTPSFRAVSLNSPLVSTATASPFLGRRVRNTSKRSGKQNCVTRHCKRREWRLHHPRPHFMRALHLFRLDSTAYCDHGQTASPGIETQEGVVAVLRSWPLGRYYQIRSGIFKGRILQGVDHIGSGSEFDIWMPSCGRADWYGRGKPEEVPIVVAEVPSVQAHAALKLH
jgi:hypothetical protein